MLIGEKHNHDGKSKNSDIQAKPVMYNLHHYEKYPSNRLKLDAVWKAHLPQRPWIIDGRVYQFSKQMPEVLQFELLPRCNIWADIFKNDFASGCVISLHFFPGNLEGSIHQFDCLWSFMEKEDLVMRSCMDDLELFVFTSKRLCYANELNWMHFLWGVFCVVKDEHVSTSISKNKISTITSNDKISETHASGVGTRRKQPSMMKTRRINSLEVPPGFSRKYTSNGAVLASFDVSLI